MKQSDMLHGVYAPRNPQNPARITRRLGDKPSHINCGCPSSWTSVIEPFAEGQDGLLAVDVEIQNLDAEERNDITDQVQRIDGSGGLAPYEDIGIVNKRGDLVRSIAAVSLQTGVMIFPDGSLQEPLFMLPNPMPPLRWEIDEFSGN